MMDHTEMGYGDQRWVKRQPDVPVVLLGTSSVQNSLHNHQPLTFLPRCVLRQSLSPFFSVLPLSFLLYRCPLFL